MSKRIHRVVVALIALSLFADRAVAITANLGAAKDNTLYQHPSGSLSNGAGAGFFAGVTGQDRITRGLLMFDIENEVPAGAIITDAILTLNVSAAAESLFDTIELRRVATDWGEADSVAADGGGGGGLAESGDATWLHSFSPGTNWTNVGGDFLSTVTAATSVGGTGFYTWSSSQLTADIQDMLDDPQFNYGWILLGNESFSRTAKRFDSRENFDAANRPLLTIEYDLPGGGSPADFDGDDDVDGDDLDSWANSYGSGNGGDADNDNDTDGSDYLVWQTEFTGPAALQAATIPEPSTAILAVVMLSLSALNRRCGGVTREKAQK